MAKKIRLDMQILSQLSSIPTAPFFEGGVNSALWRLYQEHLNGCPALSGKTDNLGNIIWRYHGDPNRENPKSIAYVAHTDHPAFHVYSEEGRPHLKVMGGLNPDIISGTEVDFHTAWHPNVGHGKITGLAGGKKDCYKVETNLRTPASFATIRFPQDQRKLRGLEGSILESPVMDDFAGVAMTVAAFQKIIERELPVDAYAVFHRAEEIALLGAHAVASRRGIPQDALTFSIETSSYMARKTPQDPFEILAPLGDGVIIRTGDKTIPAYSAAALTLLREAREIDEMHGHKTQERLMTGGTCEAAIYQAYGYRVAGIALPLKHYHNNGALEGMTQFAPEQVNAGDFHAGTELMVAAAQKLATDPELYPPLHAEALTPELTQIRDKVKDIFDEMTRKRMWHLM